MQCSIFHVRTYSDRNNNLEIFIILFTFRWNRPVVAFLRFLRFYGISLLLLVGTFLYLGSLLLEKKGKKEENKIKN